MFTIVFSVWIIFDFLAYQTSLADFQLIINRIVFTSICFLILVLAWFVDIFPRSIFKIPITLKYLVFVWASITALLSLISGWIVKDVVVESWGSNIVTGKYFLFFAIYASVLAIFPIVILITKFIKFKLTEKNQIKYILYGIPSLTVFNLLFNLLIPVITKNFEYGRFGTYSAIFFVAFTDYAILKTHLFNLRIILTETAVVIIDVILTVQIFTSKSIIEALLRTVFALIIYYVSYILVQSVKEEIRRRHEI